MKIFQRIFLNIIFNDLISAFFFKIKKYKEIYNLTLKSFNQAKHNKNYILSLFFANKLNLPKKQKIIFPMIKKIKYKSKLRNFKLFF